MAKLLRMPELAANAVEAVLQGWPLPEGAAYAKGDVIATVETEKAVADVEADADGVILKTLVPEGAGVEVGAPIAVIGGPGEMAPDIDALLAELGVASPAANDPAPAPSSPAGAVPTQPPSSFGAIPAQAPAAGPTGTGTTRRIFSSPLARRMAKEAGLRYEQITGTGPNGRIIRRDVEAAIASRDRAGSVLVAPAERAAAASAAPVAPAAAVSAAVPATGTAAFTEIPHSRIRRAVASRLTESKQTTPHFYVRGTARVDRLLRLREELNDGAPVRVSVNDLVIKAVAGAHLLVPAMNVVWAPDAVRSFSSVDVSVAIATERGLVTPVLRSVERMTVTSVASAVKDFAERARAGRLRQDELEGGAISVTNLGMYGTEDFAAIINPPQAAILAVGAARQEPVVRDGGLEVGTVMRVTLSVDHRPVDGVVAAEWMRAFLTLVENPVRILA
ncbi:pyruvate dehydrogenase complex dihydrolipoamide acetyltransferase [Planotetraspora phitsanulokensis]|uniref:Dihydrolipoamide acetyltransferase component of pyruvate dehydrogenase complex n=1 Tax=Planotetraspora phitsanulokensis TaxID=575192 RepID=A0A8J3XED0_9ACTN|nr:2-oxo acid dehydrogenase subunit E2 [Planotetraspora phitsanulokensis]GII37594.1 acetyltransferase component of pyruvate dehydrogenase complex [Planotetraspora phitsanulokensis]